jgi:hypothetical protein
VPQFGPSFRPASVFNPPARDGRGVADVREVIFTGFASDYAPFETNKLNVQALMNSFNWSLDNRIHGATSFSGGKVKLVDSEFTRAWRSHVAAPRQSAADFRRPEWMFAAVCRPPLRG